MFRSIPADLGQEAADLSQFHTYNPTFEHILATEQRLMAEYDAGPYKEEQKLLAEYNTDSHGEEYFTDSLGQPRTPLEAHTSHLIDSRAYTHHFPAYNNEGSSSAQHSELQNSNSTIIDLNPPLASD